MNILYIILMVLLYTRQNNPRRNLNIFLLFFIGFLDTMVRALIEDYNDNGESEECLKYEDLENYVNVSEF